MKKALIVIFLLLTLAFPLYAYAVSPNDLTNYDPLNPRGYGLGGVVDTSHPRYFRAGYNNYSNPMVINVYSSAHSKAGDKLVTYAYAGSGWQLFEYFYFTASGGYTGYGYYPLENPSVCMNYTRSGVNPDCNLGNRLNNYAADIDVVYNSGKMQTPAIAEHNYNSGMLMDRYLNSSNTDLGRYLQWARYSYTTFTPVS